MREKGKPRDGIGALLQAAQPTLKTEISAPHSIYRLYRRRFSLFLLPFLLFWPSSALALFSWPLNAVLRWLHGSVDLWTHESSQEPATGRCRSEHGAGRKFVTGVTVMSRRSRQGAHGTQWRGQASMQVAGRYSIELCRAGGFAAGVEDVITSDDQLVHARSLYWHFVAVNRPRGAALRPGVRAGTERPARRDD